MNRIELRHALLATGMLFALGACRVDAIQAETRDSPPLWKELNLRNDELRFDAFLKRSTVEAESFRRSLVKGGDATRAGLIAQAAVAFRKQMLAKAQRDDDSYDLSRFQLTEAEIVSSIEGSRDMDGAEATYQAFTGKWFGIWDRNHVDHHWAKFRRLKKPLVFKTDGDPPVSLLGYQYAWVGDGYGINHLAASEDGNQKYLLGYVVHVRDLDPEKEVVRRPHVGVVDGTNRLIWIAKSELFFEEMVPGKKPQDDRYVITGFRYSVNNEGSLLAKDAFQVVYSRDRNRREPWKGFKIELSVDRENE